MIRAGPGSSFPPAVLREPHLKRGTGLRTGRVLSRSLTVRAQDGVMQSTGQWPVLVPPNPAAAPISAGAPCSEPSTFLLTITASMLRGVLSSRDTPSLQHPCPAVSGRPVPYGGAGGERQAMDSGTWDQGSGPEHQPQGLWAPSLRPGPGASALGSRHCPAFWKKAGEGHGGCWARCPPAAGVLVQQAWGASPHLCLCPGGPSPA